MEKHTIVYDNRDKKVYVFINGDWVDVDIAIYERDKEIETLNQLLSAAESLIGDRRF